MEQQGWIKFYREWLDNPYICKDGEHMAVWMYLMLNATHKEKQVNFGKQVITLKVGQLLTSQREIAQKLKINRGKVDRIFALFKSVALIVARTNMQQSIVTIELWDTSQNESVARNVAGVWHECGTVQETENEKEKRSKREKDKEKEINKNEKNERIYLYSGQPTEVSCQQGESDFLSSFNETDFLSKYDKVTAPTKNEELEQLFSEFWQAYPKKVGKGYAQECFKRIRVSRSLLDTMLEAIAKQKKSDMWKRDKGQYIPNPSTWLNQKRWEDDLGGETEEKPRLRLGTYL